MRPGVFLIVGLLCAGMLTGTTRSSTSSVKKRHSAKHAHHAARRNVQQTPTPERYQEIQQALASRGYYKGTVDGKWDADSVDALRHFQADQNIPPDGRINSLSLIAMGLGPKRATASAAPGSSTAAPSVSPPHSSSTPASPATSAAPAVPPSTPPPDRAEIHQ